MKEKLTLTIDRETKEQAKRYARRRGTSVSKIVEDYLASVSARDEDPVNKLGERPVKIGIQDASEKHDKYIYKND